MRTFLGLSAGVTTGGTALWFTSDAGAAIAAGAFISITIQFWAFGPVWGGRRG